MASVGAGAGSVNRTVARTWRVIGETDQTVYHLGLSSSAPPKLVEVRLAGPGGQAYLTAVFEVPADWLEGGRWARYFANGEGRLGQYLMALLVFKQHGRSVKGGQASSRYCWGIRECIERHVRGHPQATAREILESFPDRTSPFKVELEGGRRFEVFREWDDECGEEGEWRVYEGRATVVDGKESVFEDGGDIGEKSFRVYVTAARKSIL